MNSVGRVWKSWALHCLPVSGFVGGLGGWLVEPRGWAGPWWLAALVALAGAAAGAIPVVRHRSRAANPAGVFAAMGRAMGLRAALTVAGAVALVVGGLDRLAVGLGVAVNYVALLVVETRWALQVLREGGVEGAGGARGSVGRDGGPGKV